MNSLHLVLLIEGGLEDGQVPTESTTPAQPLITHPVDVSTEEGAPTQLTADDGTTEPSVVDAEAHTESQSQVVEEEQQSGTHSQSNVITDLESDTPEKVEAHVCITYICH